MAESHEDGTTTLLNLKGCQVKRVRKEGPAILVGVEPEESQEGGCPACGGHSLYRHGRLSPGGCFTVGAGGGEYTCC